MQDGHKQTRIRAGCPRHIFLGRDNVKTHNREDENAGSNPATAVYAQYQKYIIKTKINRAKQKGVSCGCCASSA